MQKRPFPLAALPLLLLLCQCQKDYQTGLLQIYEEFKTGEISECSLDGKTVYEASPNVYDAGITLYDTNGSKLGDCGGGFGSPDSICAHVSACKLIYRGPNHISGQPGVNVYNLK